MGYSSGFWRRRILDIGVWWFAQKKKASRERARRLTNADAYIEYRDDRHRIALEQAIAYIAELHQVAQDAP